MESQGGCVICELSRPQGVRLTIPLMDEEALEVTKGIQVWHQRNALRDTVLVQKQDLVSSQGICILRGFSTYI